MKAPRGTSSQFASDNWSGICPEAWAALAAANAGHAPSYGSDDWTTAATAAIRSVFETECEVFMVFNGTAANSLALSALCRGTDAIVCHANAHINVDECGAPHFFSGGAKLLTADTPHAKLTVDAVERLAVTPHDVHSARPRALSLTQATELGTLYTADEIAALCDQAHRMGMLVHLDGARIANATAALGGTPAALRSFTIDAGVDALSFGGTKNGLLGAEAVIFLNPLAAVGSAFVRKQVTQLSSKMRFLAAQFNAILDEGLWLDLASHANEMARELYSRTSCIDGVILDGPPAVNSVFPSLPRPAIEPLRDWCFFWDWDESRDQVRWMTAWDTTVDDIERFAEGVRAVLAAPV